MKTTIIGIAGGTASGKTTIAKILYHTWPEIQALILPGKEWLSCERMGIVFYNAASSETICLPASTMVSATPDL